MPTSTLTLITGSERFLPDDPLSPACARFTLSVSSTDPPFSDAAPSSPATRPFGLRFAIACEARPAVPDRAWRFCDQRQIAVTADPASTPIHEQVAGWTHTTIGSKDGQTPGQEDWKMDPAFTDES